MLRKNIFCFIFLSQILISCKEKTDLTSDFSNSEKISFDLIRICVDSTLAMNKGINTKNYVVDLSGYNSLNLNKNGVDSFIKAKNSILPTSYYDSVIVGTGVESHMWQSMLIRFQKITKKQNGIVEIETQKFKSFKEKVDLEIILKRKRDGYICVSSKEIN